jgi:chorismate mutase/prephenate dehydratase
MRTIAYLGPEHTNTHLAALKRFGRKSRYVHAPTVDSVFTLVERDKAEYGVVPVENSLEGAVTHTLDRFIDFKGSPVCITGEIEFPIRHYFITRPGIKPATVQVVYSHPQALAQCQQWIDEHLSKQRFLIETNSTAEAVEDIVHHDSRSAAWHSKRVAAIGSREAARKHGLLALPIAEDRENKTRFLLIGKRAPAKTMRNKTSILLALKDAPGALHDALVPFKRERINLTKIESRPSKKKAWEYYFFIDFEGHESDPRVKRALRALARSTSLLRVLGSYPAGR